MKVFLAIGSGISKERQPYLYPLLSKSKYLLQSFYYIKKSEIQFIKNSEMFLLDSGAFTFLNSKKSNIDIDNYLDRYIEFINKHNVKYFFEMDTDIIHGLSKVEKMRYKLEQKTGKKCIPVWHKTRGINYYIDLCKTYNYIAVGGIAIKSIKPSQYTIFTKLLNIAKKYNCNVHGLGFTQTKLLNKYKFYSVDSTTWNSCFTYGNIYRFSNGFMQRYKFKNKRLANYTLGGVNNLKEWIKYQEFANYYL